MRSLLVAMICLLLAFPGSLAESQADPDEGYCIAIDVNQMPPVAIDLSRCEIPPGLENIQAFLPLP